MEGSQSGNVDPGLSPTAPGHRLVSQEVPSRQLGQSDSSEQEAA